MSEQRHSSREPIDCALPSHRSNPAPPSTRWLKKHPLDTSPLIALSGEKWNVQITSSACSSVDRFDCDGRHEPYPSCWKSYHSNDYYDGSRPPRASYRTTQQLERESDGEESFDIGDVAAPTKHTPSINPRELAIWSIIGKPPPNDGRNKVPSVRIVTNRHHETWPQQDVIASSEFVLENRPDHQKLQSETFSNEKSTAPVSTTSAECMRRRMSDYTAFRPTSGAHEFGLADLQALEAPELMSRRTEEWAAILDASRASKISSSIYYRYDGNAVPHGR